MPDNVCSEEVKRFMDSSQGREFLAGICAHLEGNTIVKVAFANNEEGITTTLHLSNGQCYDFNDGELCLETLREQFSGLFRELARHNSEECLMDNASNLRKGGIR